MKIRKKEKPWFSFVFLLVYATGALLYWLAHWVRVTSAVGEQHHPTELAVRVAHSGSTYLTVLALGYMIKSHVVPGLKSKRRTPSGIFMLAIFGALIFSAVGILYTGEGSFNSAMILLHDWIGLTIPVWLVFHAKGVRHLFAVRPRHSSEKLKA